MFPCCAAAATEDAEQVPHLAAADRQELVDVPAVVDKEELPAIPGEAGKAEAALAGAPVVVSDEQGKPAAAEAEKESEVKAEAPAAETRKGEPPVADAVEVQKEVDTPSAGVVLEFDHGTVTITRRPVQMTFDYTKIPPAVCNASGHAEELGIQPGWVVKKMDGQPVDPDFQVFYSTFVMRLNTLEGKFVLPLLFKKPDGALKTIVVPAAPLNMALSKVMPPTVENATNLSAQIGIKAGWVLEKYADIAVAGHGDFNSFFEDFKTQVAKLPRSG